MLLNGPLTNNVAFEYGHGFGDSFESDYDLLTELHTCSTPLLTCHAVADHQLGPVLPLLPLPLLSLALASTKTAPALPPSSTVFSTNESMLPMPTTIITLPVTPLPTHTVPGKGHHTKFPAAWLEGLARVVYTTNPYAAKHGEKKAA
ncbi:hypothetical protein PILCRDRAFT_3655 [Piloderma croceum F 1598]|uniref:Uncharacterized protein n=1 Tax=Piloderma croceum (strain F 1598) TaxID=765440 RepID=A0A0C3FU83_PILCF|nr:hypothetical protein PILCRDRAFT_3655 [Piloderma croceum F 1598]